MNSRTVLRALLRICTAAVSSTREWESNDNPLATINTNEMRGSTLHIHYNNNFPSFYRLVCTVYTYLPSVMGIAQNCAVAGTDYIHCNSSAFLALGEAFPRWEGAGFMA